MGRGAASSVGMEDAPVTVEESVKGLTSSVSNTTDMPKLRNPLIG
jgi:hypothetical protein